MDYTYNPEDIINPGKDRMRFELGDTVVDKEHEAAALSDQEYIAIITAAFENEKGWKYAKLKCLEAICMKLSFEVSTTIGPLEYQYGQRAERWRQLYQEMKLEFRTSSAFPSLGKQSSQDLYFYTGMHENLRRGE